VFVGVPQELATMIGIDLKAASPFKYTLLFSFTHGADITLENSAGGDYMAHSSGYDLGTVEAGRTHLAKGVGEKLVETSLALFTDFLK
jgi:hypothetical protein